MKRSKARKWPLFFKFLLVGLGLWLTAVACTTPAPTDTPTVKSPNCPPTAVFSPADMQARVDCHPTEYKIEMDAETFVLFAYPDSILDFVGPIFIVHVPSVSEAVLNVDGSIIYEDYKSQPGQEAIERVLNSPPQMERILERVIETEGVGP